MPIKISLLAILGFFFILRITIIDINFFFLVQYIKKKAIKSNKALYKFVFLNLS